MKQLYILLITFLITTLSFGQVILSEDFSYPDGSLVGNGTWANHSGTVGDMLISGGQVLLQPGTGSEDANIPFTEITLSMIEANMGIMCVPKWQLKSFKLSDDIIFKRISKNGLKRDHYLVVKTTQRNKKYIHDFISNFEEDFLE